MKRKHSEVANGNDDATRPSSRHADRLGSSSENGAASFSEANLESAAGVDSSCPYLSTVNRRALNFDFEKVCSVTLSKNNVYACLVCGRYFSGRGPGSAAHTHSVQASHFVFMQLETGKVFCIPDDYEVIDSSLDDIRYNLAPTYPDISLVNESAAKTCRDIFGCKYFPGFAPVNTLKHNFCQAVVQALSCVEPLRDFFLQPLNYEGCDSVLVCAFGELMRKLWSARKLKAAVSAHEFIQAVSSASNQHFFLHNQGDAAEFLKFLLRELHIGLGGSRKRDTIITLCFQGKVEVSTQEIHSLKVGGDSTSSSSNNNGISSGNSKTVQVPALIFSLELPSSPLFKDSRENKSLVPVVELRESLQKYSGKQEFDTVSDSVIFRRTFRILELPPFVIFHVNRFSKTGWRTEKNHTIVKAEMQSLDLNVFLQQKVATESSLLATSITELKKLAKERKIDVSSIVEKEELVKLLISNRALNGEKKKKVKGPIPSSLRMTDPSDVYDLVANVSHKSFADAEQKAESQDAMQDGKYLVNMYNQPQRQWFEIEDLHVKSTIPQLVQGSEAYLMIYRSRPRSNTQP